MPTPLVFIGLTVLASIVLHYLIRSFLLASTVSAILSIALFLVLPYLCAGPPEKFILIAVLVSLFYAMATSLVVGIPFVVARRLKKGPLPGTCRYCSYNLTGNVSGICPECGNPVVLK
jgi:hypothetical protein